MHMYYIHIYNEFVNNLSLYIYRNEIGNYIYISELLMYVHIYMCMYICTYIRKGALADTYSG